MNILWIVNTIFPAPSKALGLNSPAFGGWMYHLAKQVSLTKDVSLTIATFYGGKELKVLDIDNICYYLIPSEAPIKYLSQLENVWLNVCKDVKADLIHIHGTEYTHGLACLKACPDLNYVVSIQGLVGVSARYYYAGLTRIDILKNITFRDLLRRDTIFNAKRNFENRSVFEQDYIKSTKNVIGRTKWDYVHAKAINANVKYHFCNESLREAFYASDKWDINKKKRHTIFLSQAGYPIKGLHQVLKAIVVLKEEFPNVRVRVAGNNIIKRDSLKDRLKMSGYGSYIRSIIRKYNLQENVVFLGVIDEHQMVEEYKNAHVFICPSSIENSPNSVGEAQILGTPTISSFVGGVPDMVVHGNTGLLYRFEEIEMLAYNIRSIFNDDELALSISKQGVEVASSRHDLTHNLGETLSIYRSIISGE